jgi:hypothetical protein
VHLEPAAHDFGPVQPCPPHWPHLAATPPPEVPAAVVVVVRAEEEVVRMLVVIPAALVVVVWGEVPSVVSPWRRQPVRATLAIP